MTTTLQVAAQAPLRATPVAPLVVLALAVALCQGIGGALEKKGLGTITQRMGTQDVGWSLVRSRFPALLATALTTPAFVIGATLSMLVGGALLMVAISMGDAAKTGIAIGALTTVSYLAANVVINGERVRPLHFAGVACAMAGAALIALGGLRA